MKKQKMRKRAYHRAIEIKTGNYMTYVKCFACGKKIMAGERFYDGGHGCRAHVDCVEDPFKGKGNDNE